MSICLLSVDACFAALRRSAKLAASSYKTLHLTHAAAAFVADRAVEQLLQRAEDAKPTTARTAALPRSKLSQGIAVDQRTSRLLPSPA